MLHKHHHVMQRVVCSDVLCELHVLPCRTPLIAAVASNFVNLGLDCFLMFVLGWGVAGAGLATSVSQYASFGVMYYLMLKKGILRQQDMATVPGLAQVLPILQVRMSLGHTVNTSLCSAYCFTAAACAWVACTSHVCL